MRIALYAGMFKQNQDGATKTLYELISSIIQDGMEVGVWGFSITEQSRRGLTLFPVMSLPLPFYKDYRVSIPRKKIRKQLNTFVPDIIHVTVPDLMGVFFIKYAREHGIPVVTSYHTHFPSYLKSYHLGVFEESLWKYFRWFYGQSDVVFVPTHEMKNALMEKGISNTKIWSRGIHREKYNPEFRSHYLRCTWRAFDKSVILYAGRFVWYKNLETFIEIYDLFQANDNGRVVFVMAGDGPIRKELEERMPSAYFTGYLNQNDLSRVYASADLFLFPSVTETFGNVIQEALASGLPAVVSDNGGCQEIVNASGGGLVSEANNAEMYYNHCRKILSDKKLYYKLRSNGIEYGKRQSWEENNKRIINEYHILFQRNGIRANIFGEKLIMNY